MDEEAVHQSAPILVAGVGIVLFVVAATHHLTEALEIGRFFSPLLAFALDGLPALGTVYGGFVLYRRGFEPENNWQVFLSTVGGTAIVGGVVLIGIAVRTSEGRPVSEPVFQVLLGSTAGSLAGLYGGYYYARSRSSARKATQSMNTLAFTNRVLRHDIKNDMTVIQGRANVITDADPDAELVADSAQIIDRQVGKVLNVIDSTSAISEAISEDPDFDTVNIAAVVEEVVDHSQDSLPGTVTADAPDSVPILANDAIRTVVSNLIENAIEHNDTDEPSVHLTVEPDAETVRLCVHDNGPGIPDEQKRTVFEPRPEDTGRGGLNVVSTLVESYGGDIRIQDNQPRGSVFVVTFPRPRSTDGIGDTL